MRKSHQFAAAIFVLHFKCQLVFGYTYLDVCEGNTFCHVCLFTPFNACKVVHSDAFDCQAAVTDTYSTEIFAPNLFFDIFLYVAKSLQ